GGQSDPEKVDDETANGFKVRGKIFGPLLYYKDDGAKADFVGVDTLNGKTAYKIKYVGFDNQDQYFYFDTESSMLVRMDKKVKAMGKTVHSETTYTNYKKVGDVLMPFLMDVKSSEMKMGNQEMIIDKIEINPDIDISIYSIPGK
ncbi:MAG: hypothetical protein LWX07_10245, partial [Bacteroidetes bacterium]|nr:hypothetical protein [Bacteroidota bacterium]